MKLQNEHVVLTGSANALLLLDTIRELRMNTVLFMDMRRMLNVIAVRDLCTIANADDEYFARMRKFVNDRYSGVNLEVSRLFLEHPEFQPNEKMQHHLQDSDSMEYVYRLAALIQSGQFTRTMLDECTSMGSPAAAPASAAQN